jgi:hypothetical protein
MNADKIKTRMDALARCPHPTFPRERGKGINKIQKNESELALVPVSV